MKPRRQSRIFHIALLLICAVWITAQMTSELYARYTSSFSGDDGARVASFEFTDNLAAQARLFPAELSPGASEEKTLMIQNQGEVAIRYVVTIVNTTNNLPLAVVATVDGVEQTISLEDGPVEIFSSSVAPDSAGSLTWTLLWPADRNSSDLMGKMDVLKIVVTVEQVD